jgi:hypothetical protein
VEVCSGLTIAVEIRYFDEESRLATARFYTFARDYCQII